ncbi:MAG: hypothetical protein Q4A56_08635 [Porphyromonadaceae bacterium]|nr:hypothetical protein [Porphyromonadaceae bacterium]
MSSKSKKLFSFSTKAMNSLVLPVLATSISPFSSKHVECVFRANFGSGRREENFHKPRKKLLDVEKFDWRRQE